MEWSIDAIGQKEAVIEHVKAEKSYYDPRGLEAAQAFALSYLNTLPDGAGVHISVDGLGDEGASYREVKLTLRRVNLKLNRAGVE